VHFMRTLLARVPRGRAEMVAATVRTSFAQPDATSTRHQLRAVADTLAGSHPDVADLLQVTEADLCAHATFPRAHWTKLWSTNPLERLHREIKRRCDVVGIFPDDGSVIRLVRAVLAEQHDVRVGMTGAPRGCLQQRCAHPAGVACHLSGSSGSTVGRCRLIGARPIEPTHVWAPPGAHSADLERSHGGRRY
jgi:transposase-like protein